MEAPKRGAIVFAEQDKESYVGILGVRHIAKSEEGEGGMVCIS